MPRRKLTSSAARVAARFRVARGSPGVVLAAAVFVIPSALRLTDVTFKNDQFYQISGAREILRGGLPYRDYYEQGLALQFVLSAAAMAATGGTLLGEALLGVILLSLGTLLVYLLSRRASGSVLVGLVAAAFVVAGTLRTFQHYKLFVPLALVPITWRYSETRSRRDLAILGLATAVGGLLRYDLGLYVGAATAIFLVWFHARDGARAVVGRGLIYGIWVLVGLFPWLVFVQASGGIGGYVHELASISLRMSRQEPFFQVLHNPPRFHIDTSAPLLIVEPPRPAPRAAIRIRWAADVGEAARAERVARFNLESIGQVGERSWRYHVTDTSEAALRAIVTDPIVDDTDGIDRRWYTLSDRPKEPPLETWRRASPLLRLNLLPGVLTPHNGTTWLVYIVHALPVLATAILVARRLRSSGDPSAESAATPKVVTLIAVSAVATPILVRPELQMRLIDILAVAAVLGAWLIGQGLGLRAFGGPDSGWSGLESRRPARPAGFRAAPRVLRYAVVVLFVALSLISITRITAFGRQIEQSGLFEGPLAVADRVARTAAGLHTSPPIDDWAPRGAVGGRALARYVHECTSPSDRLLALAYEPELYYYADRGLATRYVFVRGGWWSSDADQRRAVEMLHAASVPVILWDQKSYGEIEANFRILLAYVRERYALAREDAFGDGSGYTWRVLVDRHVHPTGTYAPLGLPCFWR